MTSAPSAGRLLIDRYALVEVIGRGPASIVWRATDERSGHDVAVKEIQLPNGLDAVASLVLVKKLLGDGRLAAAVDHPGAVKVHDVFEEAGRPFVVMDLFAGPTLASVVADTGPLPPEKVADIGRQLVDALEAAADVGVLHRAVSPTNVVLANHGTQAQLTDFSIAASLIPGGDALPSPFSAPEQTPTTGGTSAADLWSLGATLRFAVEGGPPPRADGAIGTSEGALGRADGAMDADAPGHAGPLGPALDALLALDPYARPGFDGARRLLQEAAGNAGPSDSAGLALEPDEPRAIVREPWFFPVPVEVVPGSELALLEVPEGRVPPEARVTSNRFRALGVAVMTIGLCAFVLTLTATSGQGGPRMATPDTVVPANWVGYTDTDTGFSVSRPLDWTVTELGSSTEFRDPETGAFLRVDTDAPVGTAPYETSLRLEKAFADHNPGYERVRLVPTSFQDLPASLWEYRYTADGKEMQAVQLGFLTNRRQVSLRFQAEADDWRRYQPDVAAFERSFRTPR